MIFGVILECGRLASALIWMGEFFGVTGRSKLACSTLMRGSCELGRGGRGRVGAASCPFRHGEEWCGP